MFNLLSVKIGVIPFMHCHIIIRLGIVAVCIPPVSMCPNLQFIYLFISFIFDIYIYIANNTTPLLRYTSRWLWRLGTARDDLSYHGVLTFCLISPTNTWTRSAGRLHTYAGLMKFLRTSFREQHLTAAPECQLQTSFLVVCKSLKYPHSERSFYCAPAASNADNAILQDMASCFEVHSLR